jgi:hypothetical protein
MLGPKYIFISLLPPSKVSLGTTPWNITGQVYVDHRPVEGNDTPWLSFADLLIDEANRQFVGLTFQVDNPSFWRPMRQISERLDHRVVRYNDISTPDAQRMYPREAGIAHRFEITWASASSLGFELAQLCCGQWFWWYAKDGSWGISPPIVALGITHIDEILNEHNLTFPSKLEFGPLDVEFGIKE